jgi:5-methyltetrahydrofolate--homocysteine methyltransferase
VTATDRLRELLLRRIAVLDGAMGTLLTDVTNPDGMVLTDPGRVTRIHEDYLEAGADVIKTNTFRGTSLAQTEHGLGARAYSLNATAARLARNVADEWSRRTPRMRFVAGVIGPVRAEPDVTRQAYAEQIRGLIDGGVDLLLIETIVDTRAAVAALAAAAAEFERCGAAVPIMLSATTDRHSNLPSGETLDAFVAAVRDAKPFSLGVNCAYGSRDMGTHVARLVRHWDGPISCHPSAGLPDAAGEYVERPADLAAVLRQLAVTGLVNVVGGCCGTTPAYTRAIVEAVGDVPAATIRTQRGTSRPSPADRS